MYHIAEVMESVCSNVQIPEWRAEMPALSFRVVIFNQNRVTCSAWIGTIELPSRNLLLFGLVFVLF